jgi:hypothetical protein
LIELRSIQIQVDICQWSLLVSIKVESIGGAFNGDVTARVAFKFGVNYFFVFSASGLLLKAVSGPLPVQPRPTSHWQCSVTVTTTTRIIGVASVPVTVTAQCGGTATAALGSTGRRPAGGHCHWQCTTVLNQGDQGGSLMIPPSLILIPDMIPDIREVPWVPSGA